MASSSSSSSQLSTEVKSSAFVNLVPTGATNQSGSSISSCAATIASNSASVFIGTVLPNLCLPKQAKFAFRGTFFVSAHSSGDQSKTMPIATSQSGAKSTATGAIQDASCFQNNFTNSPSKDLIRRLAKK